MNIGKIQVNNRVLPLSTNPSPTRDEGNIAVGFNGLHVSPKTLKETLFSEKQILSIPSIKNAADKLEVLCTTGKKKYCFRGFSVPAGEVGSFIRRNLFQGSIIGTAVSVASSFMPEAWLASSLTNVSTTFACVCNGLLAACAYTIIDSFRHAYKMVPELQIKVGQDIEINNNIDNAKLNGYKSEGEISLRQVGENGELQMKPHEFIVTNNTLHILADEEKDFNEVISYFDTDDLFDANNYLKLLKKIKEKRPYDKHIFEHQIDKMGNTMLTAFFDVPLTDKNEKPYDEILDILSKEPNLDFNQKGYMGVSILEKIMLSENSKALDFAKRHTMFNYSPELNDIYVNIQDKSFKEKVKNLHFEYKDLTNALLYKSGKAIVKLMPYIEDSELLDRAALQAQVEFVLENRVNDANFELYLVKNFPQLFFDTKEGKLWRGGVNENK